MIMKTESEHVFDSLEDLKKYLNQLEPETKVEIKIETLKESQNVSEPGK